MCAAPPENLEFLDFVAGACELDLYGSLAGRA